MFAALRGLAVDFWEYVTKVTETSRSIKLLLLSARKQCCNAIACRACRTICKKKKNNKKNKEQEKEKLFLVLKTSSSHPPEVRDF